MKTERAQFQSLDNVRMMEINGGGFAYDVGRGIRFLWVSKFGISPFSIMEGIADWIMVDVINEAANPKQ